MRKPLLLIPLAVLAALALYAAAGGFGGGLLSSDSKSVIVVGEKMFMTQLGDMATNIKSYEGRTVRLEGFALFLGENAPSRFAVARDFYCCGNDGFPVGLPFEYAGEAPKDDAWIEVEGKLRVKGQNWLYLDEVKLTVKETPGQRNVFS